MDGLVLSYDESEGHGLIRAGDGTRYAFDRADWRSPEAPATGDRVDFVAAGDRATEIYLVRAAGNETAAAAGPAREDAAGYLKRRPAMVFGAVMLLGCLLPVLSVPFFSMTLLSLPSTASFFVNMASAFGANAQPGMGGVRAAVWSLYLLYAIPGAAGWLIFREIGGAATRRLCLTVGVIGLATPFVTTVVSSLLFSTALPERPAGRAGPDVPNPFEAMLQLLSYIGIGWMLIIVASIALVAMGSGWSPFGRPAARD